jgi:hypothetical protein
MSTLIRKRISQETFDEAVRENISTFGSTEAEAIADAIAQFEGGCICLDNIVKDGSTLHAVPASKDEPKPEVTVHPVLRALATIQQFNFRDSAAPSGTEERKTDCKEEASLSEAERGLVPALQALAELCLSSADNRAIAGSNVGVTITLTTFHKLMAIDAKVSPGSTDSSGGLRWSARGIVATMNALRLLCVGNDENRSLVPATAIEDMLTCMQADKPVEVQRYVKCFTTICSVVSFLILCYLQSRNCVRRSVVCASGGH